MLDAFIIEELRRREEAEQAESVRPHLELPVEEGSRRLPTSREEQSRNKAAERGVVVIDY
jgi:hypothetical protein